jgi:hypothetical protein
MKYLPETTMALLVTMICCVATTPAVSAAKPADPLAGNALYEDVKHYESFGIHRYGSPGASAAMDWLSGRLRAAGLKVEDQPFSMERQYFLENATLTAGGKTVPVLPQWWIPEDKASFELTAPIAREGEDAAGKFVRLRIPYDQGAYLNKGHRDAIAKALDRKPAAVLLTIAHPSGEIFTYNVAQTDVPWPVPVILVAPKDEPLLDASSAPVTVSVKGHYEKNVAGRNVIGRLDRGKDRTIVVSTPVTSWFTSTCERGPGIAAFLASASLAKSLTGANFVFVATGGHEIGHGGMGYFLHDKAPKPDAGVSWVHYGASLGCYGRVRNGDRWVIQPQVDAQARGLGISESLVKTVEGPFRNIEATRFIGEKAAIGELREIHAAGYPDFVGMFGLHPLFHTPIDSSEMTGPAALEPVMAAFAATLKQLAGKPKN